jgi:hypothetical protein
MHGHESYAIGDPHGKKVAIPVNVTVCWPAATLSLMVRAPVYVFVPDLPGPPSKLTQNVQNCPGASVLEQVLV